MWARIQAHCHMQRERGTSRGRHCTRVLVCARIRICASTHVRGQRGQRSVLQVDAGAAADTECAALVILRTAELVWRSSSQRVSLTIARLVADGMVRVEHVLKWAFRAADVVPEGAAAGGGAAPVPRIVAADEMTATAALETVMVLFVTMLDQGEVRAMSLQLPLRPCLLRVARGANTGVATGAPGEGSGPPGRAAGARGGSCETGGRHGCRAGAEPGRGHHRRGPRSAAGAYPEPHCCGEGHQRQAAGGRGGACRAVHPAARMPWMHARPRALRAPVLRLC
jgi:hypothetical protein